MAQMIPATIPEYTRSKAEIGLFPVLRDGLDDTYIVFHSFDLLTRNLQSRYVEGEIDYLLVSREHGFLVIEVKGGSVRYDGSAGTWFQNEHPLHLSPFEQARASKHKLREFLADRLGHVPAVPFGHAVCFPDVFTQMNELPSGADPGLCITGQQLPHIAEIVPQILRGFLHSGHRPLSNRESESIRRLLMPYCEYGTSLTDRIGQVERRVFALTQNQCELLDFISQHRHALIEGCAGSGKTVMAVKKARELANQGKSVLLLAFNRMISEQLSREVSDLTNVTAVNYHKYCRDLLLQAERLPLGDGSDEYWAHSLPQAFADFIKDNPIEYDAVIVDEGQDFRVEWWVTITDLVKRDGHFYIFYDPGQNIQKTRVEFPIGGPPFTLTYNCRNTRTVFDALKPYAGTEMHLKDGAPDGEKVREYFLPSPHDRRRQLSRILHDLVNNECFDRDRVVILGGHSINHTCIGDNRLLGNFCEC